MSPPPGAVIADRAPRPIPFWNLPNILTLGRIAVIPFVLVMVNQEGRAWAWSTFALFLLATLTDIVDGWLARRWKMQTVLGAFLDPLADKLLVMGMMIMLIPSGRLPVLLVILMLMREMTITSVRGIAGSEGLIIPASPLGKYKTAFQMTGLCFLCIRYEALGVNCHSVGLILMWFALLFALASGYSYLRGFIRRSRGLVADPGDSEPEADPASAAASPEPASAV